MGIEHNPLFLLAQMAYEEGIPEAAVIARPENKQLVKKCGKKGHYTEILEFIQSSFLDTGTHPQLLPHMMKTALHCAARAGIKGRLSGEINITAGSLLVPEPRLRRGNKKLKKGQSIFLRAGDLRRYSALEASIASLEILFLNNDKGKQRCKGWLSRYASRPKSNGESMPPLLLALALHAVRNMSRLFSGSLNTAKNCSDVVERNTGPLPTFLRPPALRLWENMTKLTKSCWVSMSCRIVASAPFFAFKRSYS